MRITIRLLTGLFLIMWLTDPLYEEEPIQVHPLALMIIGTIFFASLYSGRELPKLPSDEGRFKVDYKPPIKAELMDSLKAARAEHKEVANEKEKEHWRYIIKHGVIQGQYKVGSKGEVLKDIDLNKEPYITSAKDDIGVRYGEILDEESEC